jgi:hypothetical protein
MRLHFPASAERTAEPGGTTACVLTVERGIALAGVVGRTIRGGLFSWADPQQTRWRSMVMLGAVKKWKWSLALALASGGILASAAPAMAKVESDAFKFKGTLEEHSNKFFSNSPNCTVKSSDESTEVQPCKVIGEVIPLINEAQIKFFWDGDGEGETSGFITTKLVLVKGSNETYSGSGPCIEAEPPGPFTSCTLSIKFTLNATKHTVNGSYKVT